MNRLTQTFAAARQDHRKLLCPFVTAGFPSLAATPLIIKAIQDGGGHIVELGIPFSDPIADGPIIQASYTHALAHGTTVDQALDTAAAVRQLGTTIPIVAMVSFSLIFKRGTAQFAAACAARGIDGVILPDIPLEEAPAIVDTFRAAGLRSILLVAPTTAPDRRAAIARLCDGFIYYLSVSGITGERKALPSDIGPNIAALRAITDTPICVGFGISTPEQVRQVTAANGADADGAIVGSALIRRLTDQLTATPAELAQTAESFTRQLAAGLM